MSEMVPEINLVVGSMITIRPDEDRQEYEEAYEQVVTIQDMLRDEGIEVDLSNQPGTEIWEGSIDSFGSLYQLIRLVARLEREQGIEEVIEDGPVLPDDEDLDSAVTDIWYDLRETRFPHLLKLPGLDSYYLPVEFEKPIFLPFEDEQGEEDAAFFGSAEVLQRELSDASELIAQAGLQGKLVAAVQALESLRQAATQSVSAGLPVIIW